MIIQAATVSLELPECEGEDVPTLIENFKAQICGGTEWVYKIQIGKDTFYYDEATGDCFKRVNDLTIAYEPEIT